MWSKVVSKPMRPNNKNFPSSGIAGRAFKRSFQLADHIKIVGAKLSKGLLNIELVREIPEELKPRKIEINAREWQPDNRSRLKLLIVKPEVRRRAEKSGRRFHVER